ncbi:MAG: ATP synthase F1 subunit gamma [Opitutales bacterium]|nr:ATP synthase F1 subunit gamma [Opitutales bacterium]MBQ9758832.1 ATP synthase F1 subunit gamma [Opitutales bacterium]
MAKGLREIRNRIRSVTNTGQITRAMQLVASSKMRRAQDAATSGRPYAVLLSRILATALRGLDLSGDFSHPLMQERPVKTRGIVVIATDKGLCGGLNSNLFRFLNKNVPAGTPAKFFTVGKKATQFVARSKRDLVADFTVSDRVNFSEVRPIGEFLIKEYLAGTIDTIEIVLSQFKNTIVQVPTMATLVPLGNLEERMQAQFAAQGKKDEFKLLEDDREMSFAPDAGTILEGLPALFFKQSLYQAILEAKASEQSARMVAMKAATDNAKNLVDSLSLEYNKARQAAITNEINELAASNAG